MAQASRSTVAHGRPGLRRVLDGLLIAPLAVLLGLIVLHRNVEIQSDIWIERPPPDVWRILTATGEYSAWNPFIRSVQGELRPGGRIEVKIAPPGASPITFRPVVLTIDPDREIRWRGALWIAGLFDGEHSFRLEGSGGRTHLIQAERFSGLLVGRWADGVLRDTQHGFAAMNEALKERAEAR